MKKMSVVCFANQKGGVGKSTTCLNVAYTYANTYGKKVLLIDMDSQASSSLNVGINVTDENVNTIDELLGAYVRREITSYDWEDVKNFIYTPTYSARKRVPNSTKWETVDVPFGFDVMPSSLGLSLVGLQMSLMAKGNRIYSYYLYDLIECIKSQGTYDVCCIDTNPSLDALSMNSIAASLSGVVIPSNLDIMSFRGISTFKESASYVQNVAKERGVEHRGILGIVLSLYSERRSVDRALESYVNEFYPTPTFSQQIRESSDAKRANAEGLLFCMINKKAKEDFDNLVKEIDFAIENKEGWEEKCKETWQKIKDQREKENA